MANEQSFKPDLKSNEIPDPTSEYDTTADDLSDVLYARHAEISTFTDLEKQRGTSIPALFNQLYKFVQNPSAVSVETYKRMVDTDETVGAGVDFLTSCLAARIGRYTHPSNEITEFVNKRLDEIVGGFTNVLKELLSATWAGFSVGETVWANKDVGFVPQKIVIFPPTTVLFETERTGELTPDGIMQYQRNYNPYIQGNGFGYLTGMAGVGSGFLGNDAGRPDPFAKFGDFPFPLRTANSFNYLSIRIPTQKCIHFPFNAQGQFGNPYGKSLLRRIYKYYVMKDAILQMMMIALDRKGTALSVVFCDPNAMLENGEYDETRNGNLQGFRNKAGKGIRADFAAREAFKNVHNDSTILLPGKKGEIYDVEFMPQTSNVNDFIAAKEMCDKSMTRGLLLPSLIFGSGDGSGSWALGEQHQQTFDKICDSVNASLEHILTQQLIRQIIAYNYPQSAWKNDGLGSFAKKTLSRDEISKEAEMYEKGVTMGVIDTQDLNDLNKMRDTFGFDPRDKPIEKLDPFAQEIGDGTGLQTEPEKDKEQPLEPKEPEQPKEDQIKEQKEKLSVFKRLAQWLRISPKE
jgi:hypothetical protein